MKEHLVKRGVNRENYYRLNVEVGVGEFGMNEWNRLADISTSTRRYLGKPEVQGMNLDAASKMAKIQRAHRRIEAHAAGISEDEDNGFGPPVMSPRKSNHRPAQSWSPSPMAVELPAEDVQLPPHPQHGPPPPPSRPSIQLSPSSQDKFIIMAPDVTRPASSGNNSSAPGRRSGSDIAPPYRSSHESQASPRRSSDIHYGRGSPPPLPPKTPIPYPDGDRSNNGTGGVGGGIPMPEPLHTTKQNGHSDGAPLPYPDTDGPPPVVNKLRKPTYNVR